MDKSLFRVTGEVPGIDPELATMEDFERRDVEVKVKGASISGFAEASQRVQDEMDLVNRDMTEGIRIENKFRRAGFLPSEAHDLIKLMRNKNIGQIWAPMSDDENQPKLYILTPFKTIVEAQTYVDVIQKRFLEMSSVPSENEIAYYRGLDFVGLVKLAFKRLHEKFRNKYSSR